MENRSSKVAQYDALVVGGGFKGMMAAYGLSKQGKSVAIVEATSELGGFLSPLVWKGAELDKGPQLLNGITEPQKTVLDDIMSGYEPLSEVESSYASYWNEKLTEGFAIPDYRALPVAQKSLVLYESLHQQSQSDKQFETISEEFLEHSPHSLEFFQNWCRKFLNTDASELSPINKSFVTFFGRKLLLDNELSLELKTMPLLDNVLAAEKISANFQTHNLYPKGRHLGYFREAFVSKLSDLGVKSLLNSRLVKVKNTEVGLNATIEGEQGSVELEVDNVFFTGTIESTEELLLGTNALAKCIKPVSQVFYYAELKQHQDLPFYTMNYSDDSIARVTYFSGYTADSENGNPIICVEVPASKDSSIWLDPDTHFTQVKKELLAMGIGMVVDYKAFKVPSTYRLVLKGYEDVLANMQEKVLAQYGSRVTILTPHLLTRASIMSDLSAAGVLQID
ncbi:hypothetical protein PA25_10750 [Pseudoalteromonas sp. A25]|uniref:NAD(P)/FAD-dependent oxidoreductase n=1 Tax=Pseudoalteromonas sp. A25 TaxID=116092 RepID=UPI0012604357|nr:NAD(P)/FAD-dependent oxidoreductase [Pseudoalteromonas sp. A25]BBN81090.1 hypothetical protein PA25_10750 [Pseudoalteromonas sp. A25]